MRISVLPFRSEVNYLLFQCNRCNAGIVNDFTINKFFFVYSRMLINITPVTRSNLTIDIGRCFYCFCRYSMMYDMLMSTYSIVITSLFDLVSICYWILISSSLILMLEPIFYSTYDTCLPDRSYKAMNFEYTQLLLCITLF